MTFIKYTGIFIFLASISIAVYFTTLKRNEIPAHLLNHPVIYQENLIDKESGIELNKLLRKYARTGYINNARATGTSNIVHPHIGEAMPIKEDGTCDHPFLVVDDVNKICSLAPRIDVGKHFIMTGGTEALREPFE